jgi:beta-ureidopropionase
VPQQIDRRQSLSSLKPKTCPSRYTLAIYIYYASMTCQLSLAQIRAVPERGNCDGNFARLLALLDVASSHQPDVVITPEGFLDGYIAADPKATIDDVYNAAIDPESSVYADVLGAWAGDHRCWLVFGCTRVVGDRGANTALIFDRSGELAGVYDKTHLQAHDHKYVSGHRLPVFDSDFGPFGVLICADRRWPETVRALALQGARVVFNPTYGMMGDFNTAMMRTRAFESEIFIAFTHPRQSLVTGVRGHVHRDDVGDNDAVIITHIDLADVDHARHSPTSHLKDRRPELYTRPGA